MWNRSRISAILLVVLASHASAQPGDVDFKALVLKQVSLSKQLSDWEENMLLLEARFSQSERAFEQLIAKRIKSARELTGNETLGFRARMHVENLKKVNANSLEQVSKIVDQSELLMVQIAKTLEVMSDDSGLTDRRKALEQLHGELQGLVNEQAKLVDVTDLELAAKRNRDLALKATELSIRLLAEGAEDRSESLKKGAESLQKSVAAHKEIARILVKNDNKALRNLLDEATASARKAAGHVNDEVLSRRLLEHRLRLEALEHRMDQAHKAVKEAVEKVDGLGKLIEKEKGKPISRDLKFEFLKAAQRIDAERRGLLEVGSQLPDPAPAITDALLRLGDNLGDWSYRVSIGDLGEETRRVGAKNDAMLAQTRKSVSQLVQLLKDIEPAPVKEARPQAILDANKKLATILDGHREIHRELTRFRNDKLRPLLDLLK